MDFQAAFKPILLLLVGSCLALAQIDINANIFRNINFNVTYTVNVTLPPPNLSSAEIAPWIWNGSMTSGRGWHQNSSLDSDWEEFKATVARQYGGDDLRRRSIWEDNFRFVKATNAEHLTYRTEANIFADLALADFRMRFGRRSVSLNLNQRVGRAAPNFAPPSIPVSHNLDWTATNDVLSPVQDQGQCGSCWAFTAISAIESYIAINGNLTKLSEEQLLDCDSGKFDFGCQGGNVLTALNYLTTISGLTTAAAYPYVSTYIARYDTAIVNPISPCQNTQNMEIAASVVGLQQISKGESAIMQALMQNPIASSMDASMQSFQFYSTGIYQDPGCSNSTTNHAVLLVGYGVDSKTQLKFWLVRNSWSSEWGEDGYFRILRGVNMCGLEQTDDIVSPIAKAGPNVLTTTTRMSTAPRPTTTKSATTRQRRRPTTTTAVYTDYAYYSDGQNENKNPGPWARPT